MSLVNLRFLIEASGKSQREIAQELGISQQRFNFYVTGSREPDLEMLIQIADYFGVTTDYLLSRTTVRAPEQDATPIFRLRELRQSAGLTMKQLGTHLGLAESTVSLYETGKREPGFATLISIADYFNVTVDYLLGRTPQEEKKPAANNDDELHMITRSLNPSGHAELIRYARYLASQPEYALPPARRA